MANEIRKITLTQYNGESGPAYNVEYSTDCITYSQSLDCTNLFLPSIGSFGLCTVDEETTCVRLTSINSPCTNSVIEDLRPTTTTTSTTSTTTTSTTTTAGPTTTTTTTTSTTTTTTVGQLTADFFGVGISNTDAFNTCNNGTTYSFGLIGDEVNFCTAEVLVLDISSITSSIPFDGEFYLSQGGFVRAFKKFGFDPSAYSIGLCEFCSNFTTTTTSTTTSTTTTTTTTAAPTSSCDVVCVESYNLGEDYQGGGLYQLSIGAGISCALSQNITIIAEIESSEAVTTQLGIIIPAGNLFSSTQTTYQNQSGINDTTWGDACTLSVTYGGPETLVLLNECGEPIIPCPSGSLLCYTLETVQSAPGECFDCPGFFASTTDTILHIFDICSGSEIFPPIDIFVESRYSDNSTSSLFIPSGSTGSLIIATSDVQCAPLPSCGEIASPTFLSASIVALTGSISECCV
jgi:hypothetical protein